MKKTLKKASLVFLIFFVLVGSFAHFYLPHLIVNIKESKRFGMIPRWWGSPADYGLRYDSFMVKTSDNLLLSAVYVPVLHQKAKGTIICIHGIRSNKACFYQKMPFLQQAGYNFCAIDLRAHGESKGTYCTFGYKEKQDISTLIDTLQSRYGANIPFGVWGKSLGGAIALQTLSVDDRLAFGMVESTFADFPTITHEYIQRVTGINIRPFSNYLSYRAGAIADFPAADIQPAEIAKSIKQPVFLLHGTDDKNIHLENGKAIFKNLPSPRKKWLAVPNAGHNTVWQTGGELLDDELAAFLQSIETNIAVENKPAKVVVPSTPL